MTKVAIMQPTYLPWCGYFGLMQSVDVFVLLDTVQFAKRSWQQRNQIKTVTGPKWLSVPVHTKGKRDQLISEVELDKSSGFSANHCRSIEFNYSKTPYYKQYSDDLWPLINNSSPHLVDLTIDLIVYLKSQLKISTQLLRSSQLDTLGNKADLLASICSQIGGSKYVSPPGSKNYLEVSDAFEKIGMPVQYYYFNHPTYDQPFGNFLPYMTVIDMLFNCGERSSALIMDSGKVL